MPPNGSSTNLISLMLSGLFMRHSKHAEYTRPARRESKIQSRRKTAHESRRRNRRAA